MLAPEVKDFVELGSAGRRPALAGPGEKYLSCLCVCCTGCSVDCWCLGGREEGRWMMSSCSILCMAWKWIRDIFPKSD